MPLPGHLSTARPTLPFVLLLGALAALGPLGAAPLAAQQGQSARTGSASASPASEPSVFSASEPNVPEKAGRVLRAFRLSGAAPVVDGALDEPIWAAADSASDMVQWDPDAMQPMTERTVVRVLYDDRYLYVGARMYERDPSLIRRGIGRRDKQPPSDDINIGLDTQHDHLTGYVFITNPSGVQGDLYLYDDTNQDQEYNPVWEVRTRTDALGWTAEYRIPLSQMRFQAPPAGRVVWGFDFRRDIQRRNEVGQWIGKPRGAQGQVSRWGHLVFEEGLISPHHVEALPFAVARADNPAAKPLDQGAEAGVDLRTGIGRSATLSATFNPDFGQVEADPAVLNLSVFETFFPEKRPFFLEDGSVFVPAYGLFQLFNSRRIGKRPGYFALDSGDVVVDRPDQTTILGAGKLTGKKTGYTYGLLSALTSPEHARVTNPATGTTVLERLIEPTTSYNAVRLQHDFGKGNNLGVIGTSVLRSGAAGAFTGGFDYRIRWHKNQWQWNGHWAGARAPVKAEMVDGAGGVTNLQFNSKHWFANSHLDAFTRRFPISDVGFFRGRPDQVFVNAGGGYTQPDPGRVLRNWGINLFGGEGHNTDGLRTSRWLGLGGNVRLLDYWSGFANLGSDRSSFDDLETRGGPPIRNPSNVNGAFGLNSDSRKSWTTGFFTYWGNDTEGGSWFGSEPYLNIRPNPRVQASVNVGFNRTIDPAQWVKNKDVTGDGVNDPIFAPLHSHVVNVTLRGSVAVNRDLTFEGYMQPFVAVGDYGEPMRLAREKSFEFAPVAPGTISDPDFATHSLRGTFVLRWEYLRGSTVYLVWNLQGSDGSHPGDFRALRDLGDVFGAPLDHRFMVKANYWLSL